MKFILKLFFLTLSLTGSILSFTQSIPTQIIEIAVCPCDGISILLSSDYLSERTVECCVHWIDSNGIEHNNDIFEYCAEDYLIDDEIVLTKTDGLNISEKVIFVFIDPNSVNRFNEKSLDCVKRCIKKELVMSCQECLRIADIIDPECLKEAEVSGVEILDGRNYGYIKNQEELCYVRNGKIQLSVNLDNGDIIDEKVNIKSENSDCCLQYEIVEVFPLDDDCSCCNTYKVEHSEELNYTYLWKNKEGETISIEREIEICEDGIYTVVVSNEFGSNCESTHDIDLLPLSSIEYKLIATGYTTDHSIVFTDGETIFGSECDSEPLNLYLDAVEFCESQIKWYFNDELIEEGFNETFKIKGNEEGEIRVEYCNQVVIQVTKKTYSKNPTIEFKGGISDPNPNAYSGQYGWDPASQAQLLNDPIFGYDKIAVDGEDKYIQVFTILGDQTIRPYLKVNKLDEGTLGRDPNFYMIFDFDMESESVMSIEGASPWIALYDDLKDINRVSIRCAYQGEYRDIAKKMESSLTIYNNCDNIRCLLNFGYSTPRNIEYQRVSINAPPGKETYVESHSSDMILNQLNNRSMNQLFTIISFWSEVEIDVPFSVWEDREDQRGKIPHKIEQYTSLVRDILGLEGANHLFSPNYSGSGENFGIAIIPRVSLNMERTSLVYANAPILVYSHEFGHNMGLFHSFRSQSDRPYALPTMVPSVTERSSKCIMDYGDDLEMFFKYQIKMMR